MKHVDDYADRVPDLWSQHGGVFLPMYQSEAMWLSFSGEYPMAVKIAAGKVSAITGASWHDRLTRRPLQDYLVIPDQPWLDGFFAGEGLIRQFVAMPLGEGYTAEEQVTGEAEHGGLQIVVYPMKAAKYRRLRSPVFRAYNQEICCSSVPSQTSGDMGLAPGGLMQQEIFEDLHGLRGWDRRAKSRCFVHILNSLQYFVVTGQKPPGKQPTASQYTDAGLPWFEYYDADRRALASPSKLLKIKSVAAIMEEASVLVVKPGEGRNRGGGRQARRAGRKAARRPTL